MHRGKFERTPAMNAKMAAACRKARRGDHESFESWCFQQQQRVRGVVLVAHRRFIERMTVVDVAVDARGTTHGGGPSNYGFLAGDGSS